MPQVKTIPQLEKELIEFAPLLTEEQIKDTARWVKNELDKQNNLSYREGYADGHNEWTIRNGL